MMNTYSPALDRKAWCPKLDFHLLQDAALIFALVNVGICLTIYLNIVAYPIFGIGEENKQRGYAFPTREEWVHHELTEV
jgi:hypothetical protein